jgi:hypothetical protein
MEAVSTPPRNARAHYRHDLRALTYVTLDEGNGGIIRNLTHSGVAIQAVAALRPNQMVRLRFELRYPRLRVDARGQVVWANSSGQCGVRFLDLPPRMVRQLDEWVFGNLLESIPQHANGKGSIFGPVPQIAGTTEDDGLLVSPTARKVISLRPRVPPQCSPSGPASTENPVDAPLDLDWLSQPLSGRSLAWAVDSLIVVAALLIFSLVFLSIAHELPKWPKNLEGALAAAIFVATFYWGFFHLLAGASMGTRLARLTGLDSEHEEEARSTARFR